MLSAVGDEEAIIHLLLLAPGLKELVGRKLALAEVLQDFALLLGLAKHFELATFEVFQLGEMVVQRGDSSDARAVAGQLKLHLGCVQTLAEFGGELGLGLSAIQLRILSLLLRLYHFADDDLKSLALALLVTFATTKNGLQAKVEGHSTLLSRMFESWPRSNRRVSIGG